MNLCEVLTATPKALKLDEFVAIFVKFIDEEYAKFSWIPGYMIPKAPEDGTESKKRLPYFLKVFKEQKKLSRFSDKDTLKKIFVGLCLKKKEDIRVLAVECLINLIPELNPDIELLRKLAKEATFRDAVLSKPIVSNEICIALCAGRGFSTNMYNKSAFIYIANLPESEFLMKLLPIELKCDQIDVLEILPNKLTLNVFKSFKKIIQYVPESIKDKQEAIDFLIKVCMWGRNQDKREVLTKALSCINSIISKYECSDRSLNELLELIRPILLTFTHDLRPKYIDTLHTLIQNYEITRTDQTLIDACIGLLSNPKAETHHINKSLESISICMTETLEIEPACFIPALERVGLTNTLFAILQRIIPSVKISPLIERLLNFCIKKPEVTELLTL